MSARLEKSAGDPASDADVVAAARTGDMPALGILYGRYASALLATAYRLLYSREDAEDVVHDVFARLPEALRKFREPGNLPAWLKRVTVRVALSRQRADAARPSGALDDQIAARSHDLHAAMSLRQAVAELNPALRAVLVLKEIEGFSHSEVADLLDISVGTSEVRLHRAMRALRTSLEQREGS